MKLLNLIMGSGWIVSAIHHKQEVKLDIFSAENYPAIMKAMMTPYHQPQEKGKITWAQCKDAAGVWHFDTKASTYTPDPVKRKSTLKLHLVGSETHDLHVDHYEIDVALNGKHLTTMTQPGGDYHNTWSYDMS